MPSATTLFFLVAALSFGTVLGFLIASCIAIAKRTDEQERRVINELEKGVRHGR